MYKKGVKITFTTLILVFMLFYILGNFTKVEGTNNYNIYEKLENMEDVQYLIIGDSIGRSSGASSKSFTWYSQFEQLLKKEYKINFKRNSIVQSGATTFEGLYMFQEHDHKIPIDLAIIIFGENDRKHIDHKSFAYLYEMLIRKTKKQYPSAEILTIIENSLDNKRFANTIKSISSHYNAKNIDMRKLFQHSNYQYSELTNDGVHPNDTGYKIYANSLFHFFKQSVQKKPEIAKIETPIHEKLDIKWKELSQYKRNYGFIEKNDYFVAQSKGAYLEYTFSGTLLGTKLIRSEKGGCIDIYIDGKYNKTISTWWPTSRERIIFLSGELSEGIHHVKFLVTGEKSKNNISEKAVAQISSIIALD